MPCPLQLHFLMLLAALLPSLLCCYRRFNQGFDTVEYTASALMDQALHCLQPTDVDAGDVEAAGEEAPLAPPLGVDLLAFEQTELQRLGMPQGIVLRHRPAHFQHLFSTSAYSAAYYVYLWYGASLF